MITPYEVRDTHAKRINARRGFAVLLTLSLLSLPASTSAFTWNNCEGMRNSRLSSMSLPSHLVGDPAPLLMQLSLGQDVLERIDPALRVEHRVDGRLLPCLGPGLGSCRYESVCELLSQIFPATDECPLAEFNIPCACPIFSGFYRIALPGLEVTLPPELGPVLQGVNDLQIVVETSNEVLLCLNVSFEITRCDELYCAPDTSCAPHYCFS